MQNGTVSGPTAPSDGRNDTYQAVVVDLASLIERVRASLAMIEAAVAWEAAPPTSLCWTTSRPAT